MAIAVALLFKYFVLEISKIPSGSMQPTLMGNPETGVFDRTIVDKLSFHFRDPKRWEIVVFKHPLEHSRIMVKRLVGMPGEELKIERGDLWTRAPGSEAWTILRRPPEVQREAWRSLETRERKGAAWSVVRGGKDWRVAGHELHARGEGAVRYLAGAGPITDEYLDGYPPSLVSQIGMRDPAWGRNPVGDLRLEGELTAEAGTEAVTFEFTEGQRAYEFRLPGPAALADATVELRVRDSVASSERYERGASYRLPAGARVAFGVENLDDRLALEVDGETLVALDIESSERQEASLTLGLVGAGAEAALAELEVFRDIYYLTPPKRSTWSVEIPLGSYVMLGDNTQDSADSRLWEAKSYEIRSSDGAPLTVRGNYRGGNENPSEGLLASGRRGLRFRDQWGEVHWFSEAEGKPLTFQGNAPLVTRDLVVGRALAVFWPIKPFQGLWRVGWLR